MSHKIYKVGGCVRDKLLGLKSKDIDYVFVISDLTSVKGVDQGFQIMKQWMIDEGFTIWLETPEMFTIRAKFPSTHKEAGVDADFVLARKEVGYIEGTRRPILELGTLYDDLYRRDFTVNAMAEDEDGNIIDLFNGKQHLEKRMLFTPNNDVYKTLDDDPLRILRAIRFAITKGFGVSNILINAIWDYDYDKKMNVVSSERIREELHKCLKFDTWKTIDILIEYAPKLYEYIFRDRKLFWLKPTNEL